MKTLLINPGANLSRTLGPFRNVMSPLGPLGVAYLAGSLQAAGERVAVLDQNAEGLSVKAALRRIREEAPDVVGISCLTPSMGVVTRLVAGLRQALPRTKVILGNIHASYFAEELIDGGVADCVIHGEGEDGIVEVVQALSDGGDLSAVRGISYREDGHCQHTPPRPRTHDLDRLPYPAWELFPIERYRTPPMLTFTEVALPLLHSRGCPFDCIFCSQNYVFGQLRMRSIESVCDEIETLHQRLGVRYFGFADSIFPVTREDGLAFAQELINRGLHNRVKWFTESRVDLVDADLLSALKTSGLELMMFGFESGNQDVLNHCDKQLDIEQSVAAMRLCRKLGIKTFGFFMLGLPGDTADTCRQTIRFACQLDCDVAKFNLVVPYPGSRLYEREKARIGGWRDFERFSPWFQPQNGEELPYVPDGLTTSQMLALQKEAVRRFYLRPQLIARYLLQGTLSLPNLYRGARILLSPSARSKNGNGATETLSP